MRLRIRDGGPPRIKFKPFTAGVKLTPTITIEGGLVKLDILCEPVGEIKAPQGEHLVVSVPLDSFPDPSFAAIEKWALDVYVSIRDGKNKKHPISSWLMNQACQNYLDISNLHLGVSPTEIIKMHAQYIAKFYRKAFGLRWRRGNFSLWTKVELERVVMTALLELNPAERTITGVLNKLLASADADRAPPSDKALRELIRTQGLSWKAMLKRAKEAFPE